MHSAVSNQVFTIISGFDALRIHFCTQDDCLAINKGQNITFENNFCEGGHGISIVRCLVQL